MKKSFILMMVAMSSLFFLACEEEAVPVPLPPMPPQAPAEDVAEIPPAPEPVAAAPQPPSPPPPSMPPPPSLPPPPPPPSQAPPKMAMALNEDAGQLKSGRYTIQVGVVPDESAAKGLVKKMAANGIKAYYVDVSNPDKLYGLYYRVRVGFFNSKFAAEDFAKSRLEPIGYKWWVDLSRNDTVGNSVAAAPSAKPASPSSADSELEEAKRAYKEIAKEATKAK